MIDEKKLLGELDAWWETLSPRTDARDSIICDVIESVIEKINNAEKVGEWIPTTERMMLENWLDSVQDPELRDILRLQYINGLTQEDIADEFCVDKGKLMKIYSYYKKKGMV